MKVRRGLKRDSCIVHLRKLAENLQRGNGKMKVSLELWYDIDQSAIFHGLVLVFQAPTLKLGSEGWPPRGRKSPSQ